MSKGGPTIKSAHSAFLSAEGLAQREAAKQHRTNFDPPAPNQERVGLADLVVLDLANLAWKANAVFQNVAG